MSSRVEAALAFAKGGELVFPVWWTDRAGTCACPKGEECRSAGKHPLTQHGLDDASGNPQTWWERWPSANLAVRTDQACRIDIDAVDVAEDLAADVALQATTPITTTPRGGIRITLKPPVPILSQTLVLSDGRGLGDLKGVRGYVLVPPSTIGGRGYVRLSPDEVQPFKVDDPLVWLRDILRPFGLELAERSQKGRAYHKLGQVIREGEGRHNALISLGGRIWVEGMEPSAFLAALEAVNGLQFEPPLPAAEVEQIAQWFIEGREPGRAVGWGSRREAQPVLTPPPAVWRPMSLPDEHYVLRYTRYARSRTDAPPQYRELLALVQLSAVVGRTLRIPLAAKPDGMFCNLWALLLGESTLFRKSTSEDFAVDLLRAVDHEMFLANDQSPQGLWRRCPSETGARPSGTATSSVASCRSSATLPGWLAGRSF